MTPGHDFNDFEAGQRCKLPVLSIIDLRGKITAPAPEKYRGMSVDEARRTVVADLEAEGLLAGTKDYTVPRGRCDRSGTGVEPLLSDPWWVRTEPLAQKAIEVVEKGTTRFVPELWTKTYMHWMTHIKDWTISRQLWWGHRIPAWFCSTCKEIIVAREAPPACTKCGGTALRQDEDVLDTWFSSALWPFSTLGWPEDTRELKAFYPNAVLVTGPDIIFFWVARMMMMGLHFIGKVPFRAVYLTPIVTDENGDKMSKVKGNVIDPLDIVYGATLEKLVAGAEGHDAALKYIKKNLPKGIPACGADALRFSLAAMTTPGRNIRLSMDRIEGYRHFINKLWNASRFAMMNLEDFDPNGPDDVALSVSDAWILSRLQAVAAEMDAALEQFRFSEAANTIYHFVWDELCDWYIELAKPALVGKDGPVARRAAQSTLATVLEQVLRLLHPFAPFVTEEIWQKLPRPSGQPDSIMITVYPRPVPRLVNAAAEATMARLQAITVQIRTLRSTYNVPPSLVIPAELRIASAAARAEVEQHRAMIELVARVTLSIAEAGDHVAGAAKGVVGGDIEVVVPLAGLIDMGAERARITKEIGKVDKDIESIGKKLENEKFLANAPAEVVEEQRARLADESARRSRLVAALEALGA